MVCWQPVDLTSSRRVLGRRYAARVNRLLGDFSELTGVPTAPVTITHGDDVLPSQLATTELAVGAVASAAAAASYLGGARGGPEAGAQLMVAA